MIPKIVLKSVLWRGSETARYFYIFQLLCFSLHPTGQGPHLTSSSKWVGEPDYSPTHFHQQVGRETFTSPSLQGGWLCDVDVTQDGQVWIGRTHLSQHLRWEKLNPISKFLLSLSALPKSHVKLPKLLLPLSNIRVFTHPWVIRGDIDLLFLPHIVFNTSL